MPKYFLMNKDEQVLEFEIKKDILGDIEINNIVKKDAPLPIGSENLKDWLSNRQAPKHKSHIRRLLREWGCEDLEGFIKFTHAASLNDTFWVRPINSKLTWNDVSLYINEFDENVARIAFEGGLYGERFSTTSLSPEYEAQGAFNKCWKRTVGNKIMLYKTGTDGFANAGLEPYSEYYSAQLASIICKENVDYELDMYRGKLISKCELFTDEEYGFVTVSKLFPSGTSDIKIKQFFDERGLGEDFARMVVLDALIINTDRHRSNYGVIVKNSTQEIVKFAPIFDNNQALLPYASMEELTTDLPFYLADRPVRIGDDFNEVANAFLTPEIEKDLNKLRGFKFKRHEKYNLPEERLKALENMVNGQIDKIIQGIRLYNAMDVKLSIAKEETLPEMFRNNEKD